MAKKQEKSWKTSLAEAKTFHDVLALKVANVEQSISNLQHGLKQSRRAGIAIGSFEKISIKYHESKLRNLEARRRRHEQYQENKKLPAALRKQIAKLETDILRQEPGDGPIGRRAIRLKKEALVVLFEQADQIGNPPMPLTTTNKAFRVGRKYPGQAITRRYDANVWDVLRGHFERLPREKGQRASFKIVALLPEKAEYLQLKERHFTRTLESLVEDAYGVVDELQVELENSYKNTPEGLQESAVGEARLEAATELDNITSNQPEVPQSISSLRLVHYPKLHQNSRGSRAGEAADLLRAVSAAVGQYRKNEVKLKKAEAKSLDDFCQHLDDHADEIEDVEFPGMFG